MGPALGEMFKISGRQQYNNINVSVNPNTKVTVICMNHTIVNFITRNKDNVIITCLDIDVWLLVIAYI